MMDSADQNIMWNNNMLVLMEINDNDDFDDKIIESVDRN